MTFPRGGAHDPGDSPETEADRSARVARERTMLDDARREYEQGLGIEGERARAFLDALATGETMSLAEYFPHLKAG